MTLSLDAGLPEALEPLRDDLVEMDSVLAHLDAELDATIRAELGAELVRVVSRFEDTFERGVLPMIEERSPAVGKQARAGAERLNDHLAAVFHWTHNVAPIEVHKREPNTFENALAELEIELERALEWDRATLYPLVDHSLSAEDQSHLRERVEHARRRATGHPNAGSSVSRPAHKASEALRRVPDRADK